MRSSRISLFSLVLLLLPAAASAAPGEGSAGGLLARLPFGARGQALGGAHAGLPGAPEAFLANPAALARTGAPEGTAAFHLGPEDVSHGGVAGAVPVLPWLGAGLAVQTLSAGVIEARDYAGNPLTAELQNDVLASAGAAAAWGGAGIGAAVKYYRSTLTGAEHGSFVAADLGVEHRFDFAFDDGPPPWPEPGWLRLGLAASNLGSAIGYGAAPAESDPPPALYRAGAALGRQLSPELGLLGTLTLTVPASTARIESCGGLELTRAFGPLSASARAGFRARPGTGVLAAGGGLQWRGARLDYAFVAADDPFGPAHQLSAGFNLGDYRRGVPAPEP